MDRSEALDGATPDLASEPEAWFARVQAGDADATMELYERYKARVHKLVWQALGPDADHDDVVQQTFVAVFANVKRVRKVASLDHWVATIALNTSRTTLRRRRVSRLLFSARRGPVPAETTTSSQGNPHTRYLVERTYQLLDRLPVEERLAFVFRHVDQCTLPEAAARLCCSLATVKRRLGRAETKFQRLAAEDPALSEWMAERGQLERHVLA